MIVVCTATTFVLLDHTKFRYYRKIALGDIYLEIYPVNSAVRGV
jgi:hypothetical protein